MDTCSSVGTLVLRLLTLAEAERFPHLGNKNGVRVTAVFILPGVWFLTRTGLTVPVMVVEGHGPVTGVRRSLALSSRRCMGT